MGWDGMGWDGMGWDGMGWDGMGWDGMGQVGGIRAAAVLCPQMEVPSSRGNNLQATQGISLAPGECILLLEASAA
jgi:hypothetical protein